jgi:hypothetical protein
VFSCECLYMKTLLSMSAADPDVIPVVKVGSLFDPRSSMESTFFFSLAPHRRWFSFFSLSTSGRGSG